MKFKTIQKEIGKANYYIKSNLERGNTKRANELKTRIPLLEELYNTKIRRVNGYLNSRNNRITHKSLKEQGWLQTDGSLNTLQYGRKVNKTTWEYREVDKKYKSRGLALYDFENWHEDIIDVTTYSVYNIEQSVGHYGYTLNGDWSLEQNNQKFSYEDSVQLICECIFELEH